MHASLKLPLLFCVVPMRRDLSRSRAILISNAFYHDDGIPDLPAAVGCASAMQTLLTSELCGWPAGRLDNLADLSAPDELARHLFEAVNGVEDVLLLYYVGPGLLPCRAGKQSELSIPVCGH